MTPSITTAYQSLDPTTLQLPIRQPLLHGRSLSKRKSESAKERKWNTHIVPQIRRKFSGQPQRFCVFFILPSASAHAQEPALARTHRETEAEGQLSDQPATTFVAAGAQGSIAKGL